MANLKKNWLEAQSSKACLINDIIDISNEFLNTI